MEEFNSIEKLNELFKSVNGISNNNNYFVAFKDMTKNSGMVGGMEYPYDALLINYTDNGLGCFYLNQEGIAFKHNLSKMHVKNDSYFFINNSDIEKITIKKFALLNNKTKKVAIKLKDGKTHQLYVNLDEKLLPYHKDFFENFIKKYS